MAKSIKTADTKKVKAVTSDVEVTAILDDYALHHSGDGADRMEWATVKIKIDAAALDTDNMLTTFVHMCNGTPVQFKIESHAQGRPKFTGDTAIKSLEFKATGKPPVQTASFDLVIPVAAIDPRWSQFRRATKRAGATITFTSIQQDLFDDKEEVGCESREEEGIKGQEVTHVDGAGSMSGPTTG
jgi:hypothetical protein